MGKQINYFMVGQDELMFLDVMAKFNDSMITHRLFPLSQNEVVTSGTKLMMYIKSENSNLYVNEYGFVDGYRSDVIEYSRTSVLENHALPGRLWAEMKYYDEFYNPIKISKEKWFSDRFEAYRKWIRKHFRRSTCKSFYIGEEAYKLYQSGELKTMAGPIVPVEF